MLRNYIKIALRSLLKNKAFTLINVFGLFIGLTAFLLIYSYVQFERGYDQYHDDSDRIYRVVTDNVVNGVTGARDAMSFSPLGQVMLDEIPEVVQYTTTMQLFENIIFKKEDELINESRIVAADERFLDIYSYSLIHGGERPFKDPYSLVLTKRAALRLLGEENVVGRTIQAEGIHRGTFKVTGIMDDLPGNTHYKFDILMSFKTIEDRAKADGWRGYNFYTYVKLKEGASMEEVQAKLPAIKQKYVRPDLTLAFTLQPMTDIHLTSGFSYEAEASGNGRAVDFLFVIALFIILIAWVNYINLSTARAMDRAKEVGLRKVVGAGKFQLILQFMLEALFINIVAAVLALTSVQLLGPMYNNLLGRDLIQFAFTNNSLIILLLAITFVGSLFSGFYPALVLSSFKPITVLKGNLRNSRSGMMLRKGLVVFQFIASLILIAGTAIVYLQIEYMKNRDLGIDVDHTLSMRMPSYDSAQAEDYNQRYELLLSKLETYSEVLGVASASSIPGSGRSDIAAAAGGLSIVGKTEVNQSTHYRTVIDEEFFPVMNVALVTGRNFVADQPSESRYAIVNEALLKHLGFSGAPEEALNQRLRLGSESSTQFKTIIGVVKDYNRRSLKDGIEPTIYFHGFDYFVTKIVIRLSPENISPTLKNIGEEWSAIFPNVPFEYNFIDEQFDAAYREDQQFGSIFGVFSMLAMAIAGLGLFGLSSFIAIQRSKEIGVRKVLGASVFNIVKLISKDFLILVMVAFIIGSPLVYFIMDGWLNNYAFRINLPVWILPISGLVLLCITFFTVGYQTARAARANPVDTLRFE